MIKISDDDIIRQHSAYVAAFKDKNKAPFTGKDFYSKAFPVLQQRANKKYPYVVKIAKPIKDLLQGDFEPAREIVVKEPFMGPFGPIWFGDTSKGVRLRMGYVNGDSRYICEYGFYDTFVHGLMGGATGQGKSVALNTIIYGLCQEYPPWELNLVLSDAKIVEFKSIAMSRPMPQISTVSATGDADYLISVLAYKENEMKLMNSVFALAANVFGKEVKKVEDFRKVTGLTIPRNVIIMDEFQAMFMNAKKKAKNISALIDSFGRLGRNTGYHLYLTSQEIGSDLPKEVLNQIALRAAVGCDAAVSNMILGNEAAKNNKNKYGRLLINTESQRHDEADNVLVRVPFITDDEPGIIAKSVIELGKELQVTPVLQFYDEQKVFYEKEYYQFINALPKPKNEIYLGEPSFMMDDPVQCVRIPMDDSDVDNIMVIVNSTNGMQRYFLMLKYCVSLNSVNHLVICANNFFISECGADRLTNQLFKEGSYKSSTGFKILKSVIAKRILCLSADEEVFREGKTSEVSDNIFYSIFEKGSKEDTLTNRSRCFTILGLLQTDEVTMKSNGLLGLSGEEAGELRLKIMKSCIAMYEAYGCFDTKLTVDKMPTIIAWILGLERIIGLGRDSKSSFVTELKMMMLDAFKARVRFITFSTTMEDLNDLQSATKWFIFDDVSNREINRVKCECYPEQKSGGLGVLWDVKDNDNGCKKFKKMFLDGELPPS